MPGMIRGHKKAAKIAYALLKTPKDQQQKTQPNPSKHLLDEWFRDSSTAQ